MDRYIDRFIESEKFPSMEVSEKAVSEKGGGGRPPYWEMVFWWTRKPLITARAVVAGAILPADFDVEVFKRYVLRLYGDKSPHRLNPDLSVLGEKYRKLFRETRLLDPFAGFGSIPLEALRLGVGEVVAVELLPTAAIFLKAVLEYPKKYGEELIKDVEKWGNWVIEQLKNDPDIRELYDPDVAVYIGTWEVKCPHCGRYTPLIGNYWLARVEKNGRYVRLAYMKPRIKGDQVLIDVVDVNRDYNIASLPRNNIYGRTITLPNGIKLEVPEKNIDAQKNNAKCLVCGNTIKYIDPETMKHYIDKSKLPNNLKKKLEFYPKYALKQWNKLYEEYLEGKTTLQELQKAPARPRLLVKVKIKNNNLEFQPTTTQDQQKLWLALQKLKQNWKDPDIPTEPIPRYESRSLSPYTWGFDRWFKFFNPRQLLTLIKIAKLIRRVGKKIDKEKQKEGWNREEAYKYARALVTYLTIVFIRYIDYNSVATIWNYGGQLPAQVAHTLSMRGIAMSWNYGDTSPFIVMSGTGTLRSNLSKMINKALKYLISNILNKSIKVSILLDDTTTLGKLGNNKFDLIVSDPPYKDDVPYTELSDFYFVWLKRVFCDVVDGGLEPRFHREFIARRVGARWRLIDTQWREFARKEVSFNPGRYMSDLGVDRVDQRVKEYAYKRYLERLSNSFIAMRDHLVDDGLIVTYYNHTDPGAWKDLLYAGWVKAGLQVTATWPLDTESKQSIVKRGKKSLDTSLILVWRKKRGKGLTGISGDVYREAVEEAREWASKIWAYHRGLDAFIGVMGRVLRVVTRYDKILLPEEKKLPIASPETMDLDTLDTIVKKIIFPAAARGLIEYLIGESPYIVRSPEAYFYILFKLSFMKDPETTRKLMSKEKRLDPTSMTILSIASTINTEKLVREKIVLEKRPRSSGRKELEYILYSPLDTNPGSLEAFIKNRGLDPVRPRLRNSIDALHLLEYYAVKYDQSTFKNLVAKLEKEPRAKELIDEARGLAMLIYRLFEGDPERELAKRLLEYLGEKIVEEEVQHKTIDRYFTRKTS